MSLDVRTTVADGVATLVLVGTVDSASARTLDERIVAATDQPVSRLVLVLDELTFLSSAGLRSLLYAHQRLGRGVHIELVNARPEVAETIRMTGFDQSVTLLDGPRDPRA